MISAAAAFPQKFGFEFWKGSGNSCSLWSTKWESYHPGKDQFAAIDENGDGAVSFDEWWVASRERGPWDDWRPMSRLGFAYSNYKEQSLATAFDKVTAAHLFEYLEIFGLEKYFIYKLLKSVQLDKETFVKDCKNVGDTSSDSYKKIYWFSWKCFQVKSVLSTTKGWESNEPGGRRWQGRPGVCWGVWHDDQCRHRGPEEAGAACPLPDDWGARWGNVWTDPEIILHFRTIQSKLLLTLKLPCIVLKY